MSFISWIPNTLKLVELIGHKNIPVAVANNPVANIDSWITGKINKESIKETDGKVSFDIDCKNYGAFGYKYKATQKTTGENKYNMTCITAAGSIDSKHTVNQDGVEYELDSGLLKRNDDPLVHVN